jgi:LuxR family maltose regulon positive regulatory protein
VLHLLATELTQREIGRELYLSLNTVKTHARNIFRKLDASSRDDAVMRARERGLL